MSGRIMPGPDGAAMANDATASGAAIRLCPHCASANVQRWGAARGLPRYRCGDCKRTFNPLTGTSLARLRGKDKWFLFLHTVTQNKSIRKSAEICGVDNTTVLRWRQRFKACTEAEKRSILLALTDTCSTSLQTLQEAAADHAPLQAVDLILTILGWLS